MTDYQELKRLAELVPTDCWKSVEERQSFQYEGYMVVDSWNCHIASTGKTNGDGITADFIAAANPAVVLALIEEIGRLGRYAEAEAKGSDAAAQDLIRQVREIRQLKAEVEALRKGLIVIRENSSSAWARVIAASVLINSRKEAGNAEAT